MCGAVALPSAEPGSLKVRRPRHSAYTWLLSPSPPATAPQQEADSESNTETLNKSSQGSSSSTQAAPSDTASASKEKETSAEKSKDSGSVSTRTPLGDTDPLGQGSPSLSPGLPPRNSPVAVDGPSSRWGSQAAGGDGP